LNESTFDKLRTPTQKSCNISSIITEDVTGMDEFKISNLLEKSSVSPSEQGESEVSSVQFNTSLKEDFCSRLIKLTSQNQNSISVVSAGTQTRKIPVNKNYIKDNTKSYKPVFEVISTKRKGYQLKFKNVIS